MGLSPVPILPNIPCPTPGMTYQQWCFILLSSFRRVDIPTPPLEKPSTPYPLPINTGVFQPIGKEKDWRDWVSSFLAAFQIDQAPVPTETEFPGDDGWRAWGIRFLYIYR